MEFEFIIKENTYKISLEKKDDKIIILSDREPINIDYQIISDNCISLIMNNESYTIFIVKDNNKWFVKIKDEEYIIETPSMTKRKSYAAELSDFGENMIVAPMPGKILKIKVNVGDLVTKKQSLVIVEAMKMEHDIRAPFDAKVTKINFQEGQIVDTESPIIELEKISN